MDAEFTYGFVNKFQDSATAQAKVEWVCENKCRQVADDFGATSYVYVATDESAVITIGLSAELAAMTEAQRTSVVTSLFKGTLEKWIPQINISEEIAFS